MILIYTDKNCTAVSHYVHNIFPKRNNANQNANFLIIKLV